MTDIKPEQMAVYQASARVKQVQKRQQLLLRQQQGLEIAHQAARLLKERFGAVRVVLFEPFKRLELDCDRRGDRSQKTSIRETPNAGNQSLLVDGAAAN